MPKINFTKMQGLGNDFILIEDQYLPINIDYATLAKKLCDRHFGIGADGLIIINPKNSISDADSSWRIFNSDGSEPEMCGNGIRCFAKYVYERQLVKNSEFTVSTIASIITSKIETGGLITVDMGEPILNPVQMPVNINRDRVINFPLSILDKTFSINCVSMGNPHCVIFVKEDIDLTKFGPLIERHELFPHKTNVEFVEVLSREHIKVNVWERGCGITLACGTGACAAVTIAVLNNHTERKVKVTLPGGDLIIHYDQTNNHLFMSGPAEYVFEGNLVVDL